MRFSKRQELKWALAGWRDEHRADIAVTIALAIYAVLWLCAFIS